MGRLQGNSLPSLTSVCFCRHIPGLHDAYQLAAVTATAGPREVFAKSVSDRQRQPSWRRSCLTRPQRDEAMHRGADTDFTALDLYQPERFGEPVEALASPPRATSVLDGGRARARTMSRKL